VARKFFKAIAKLGGLAFRLGMKAAEGWPLDGTGLARLLRNVI
jgi:hypothetical protein